MGNAESGIENAEGGMGKAGEVVKKITSESNQS